MIRSSASTWARAAISGTTPPNAACASICESTTFERMRPGPCVGRSTTAAPVSSQVVSMPSTIIQQSVRSRCKLALLPPPLWGRVGEGGRCCCTRRVHRLRPPPLTPPDKGEGNAPSVRRRLQRCTRTNPDFAPSPSGLPCFPPAATGLAPRGHRLQSAKPPLGIGTASLRRQALIKRRRPDLAVVPLRGNVETRLRKLAEGEVDAIVLALAGLKRLGLAEAATAVLSIDEFLPAVGQGVIAIEARGDDGRAFALLRAINHAATAAALGAERAFLAVLEGSCRTPNAGHAAVGGGPVAGPRVLAQPARS